MAPSSGYVLQDVVRSARSCQILTLNVRNLRRHLHWSFRMTGPCIVHRSPSPGLLQRTPGLHADQLPLAA